MKETPSPFPLRTARSLSGELTGSAKTEYKKSEYLYTRLVNIDCGCKDQKENTPDG